MRGPSLTENERLEHLEALRSTNRRVLELMTMMEPLVEKLALQGDPLAAYLVDELEKARTAMKSENIAAHAFLAEVSGG
jgi:hypothetical protein